MKKVLVTGGTGFIGNAIVNALHAKGYDIISFDTLKPKGKLVKNVTYILDDIRNKDVIDKITKDVDCVFHTAGVLGTSLLIRDIPTAVDININGSINLFELAKERHFTVINLGLIPEWKTPYMSTKNAIKDIGIVYSAYHDADIRTVEVTHAYGPTQNPYQGKAVPNFIINALTGNDVVVLGSPDKEFKYMDLLYYSDAATAIVRIAEESRLSGKVLQLGCGAGIDVNELAKYINSLCGNKSKIIHQPMRNGEPDGREERFKHADLTDWYKYFDTSPVNVPLENGLKQSILWYKDALDNNRIDVSKVETV